MADLLSPYNAIISCYGKYVVENTPQYGGMRFLCGVQKAFHEAFHFPSAAIGYICCRGDVVSSPVHLVIYAFGRITAAAAGALTMM